jgi:ribosomal protein L37AE/L43A
VQFAPFLARQLDGELVPGRVRLDALVDVSAGTYQCTNCDNQIQMRSQTHIPPCPQCGNGAWATVSGGDSVNDPYPSD